LTESGFETWRIVDCEIKREKILLELSRNFAKEATRIELIPRTLAEEFRNLLELARLERANNISRSIVSQLKNTKPIRVELNKENGRFAQIIIEDKKGSQIVVLADVSDSLTPEIFLSSSIILLSKLERRVKKPINEVWIFSEKRVAEKLLRLHACLKDNWKRKIRLWEILNAAAKGNTEKQEQKAETKIQETKALGIADLWHYRPAQLRLGDDRSLSNLSRKIIDLKPNRIDRLLSKNGETLRYLGLPFLRLRRALDKEKAWYGIEGTRQILNHSSYEDFYEMIDNLGKYRRFDSPNKQHVFYAASPEAWLESLLRNNIKLLDVNLILSPIYNQFRTSQDKIDLLAIRKDGQLVIVELKVSADREMLFQAVDYWRKIELQRRKGIFDKVRLFGDLNIADKPAIVYLVAPTLSFHGDFKFLSKTISNEIEMFRFDLAENWRKDLKVLGRRKI